MSREYLIRFNKSRGQPGRGSEEHVWRVFEGDKEYIVKHVKINVYSFSKRTGEEWNIACNAVLTIDRENSVAIFN